MKLTRQQKIKFIQNWDNTGVLQFCEDSEILYYYNNAIVSYRIKQRNKKDELLKNLHFCFTCIKFRLIAKHGRKKGIDIYNNMKYYVIKKETELTTINY